MLSSKPIDKIVFLSVKTTSQHPDYSSMPALMKGFFYNHFQRQIEELSSKPFFDEEKKETTRYGVNRACEQMFTDNAALMPEFGKIICVCLGAIENNVLKTMCFSGDDDSKILETLLKQVGALKNKLSDPDTKDLCGHGIKHFHAPFIGKRVLIHGFKLPERLDLSALKPWEIKHLIDTHEEWKMGQWNAYVSLPLLGYTFGIERTTEAIVGKEINDIYWKEKDMKKIEAYAADDVWTLANVYTKMKGLDIVIAK